MVQSLEEVLAEAERTRADLTDLLAQFVAEREALKVATKPRSTDRLQVT